MPWSREYLRKLLYGDDPIKSVYELANIWSARSGRRESDPFFGLLPFQYVVTLYLNYEGDVGNGGHSQYFMNPVGAYANETLAALKELGFPKIRSILARAIAVFPGGNVPKDSQQRNELIDRFPDDVFASWKKLDREMYCATDGALLAIQKYLQRHESEILEREGG